MGLTPLGKAKGFISSFSSLRHGSGAAGRTFLLESNRFELQWIVDWEFPLAHLKISSLIPLLQIICCACAAEKQSGKGQPFIR